MDKIYFYDNGIRNILIDNLKPLNLRTDVGNLWENFIVAERRKQILYHRMNVHAYFWRTYSGAEIDYVEETRNGLLGYEIKMNKDKFRIPRAWKTEYGAELKLINRNNYLDFLLKNND
jgi:predicted AAA+ superfamily ATPase